MDLLNTHIETLGDPTVQSPIRFGETEGFFVHEAARVRYAVETRTGRDLPSDILFEKAGPRQNIFFDPSQIKAAIVTCGGICPGLNNVIRSAVREFYFHYGVKNILGVRFGYAGLNAKINEPPMQLTPDNVDPIHEKGGTILGTSRGSQPTDEVVDFMQKFGINILLCIGGDGTLRGANDIGAEIVRRRLPISVIGIPKTIDNDVLYSSRTFGLATAAEVSRFVLSCAHVEAKSAFNGVGLVKLMGRDAGFIAAASTLASQDVNFCLVPEVPLTLDGPRGFLEKLRQRLHDRNHALIVVAEGAGQDLLDIPLESDASGNKRYGDIGSWLKEQIKFYFKRLNMPVDIKYFDPSYLIRSVPANVDDAILCDQFARNAVHAGMAGKTRMMVSFLNGTFANVPIALAVSGKRKLDCDGALWTAVLATTCQPREWR